MRGNLIHGCLLVMLLSSCGGGNGGNSTNQPPIQITPPPPPAIDWIEVISQDPLTLDEAELQENYWGYAQHLYQGMTEPAALGPRPIQEVTRQLLGTGTPSIPYSLPLFFENINSNPTPRNLSLFTRITRLLQHQTKSENKANKSAVVTKRILSAVNLSEECQVSGSIDLIGELDQNGVGILDVNYNQCNQGYGTLTGTGAASLHESSNSVFQGVLFFKEVSLSEYNEEWTITGHYLYGTEESNEGSFDIYFSSEYLLFEAQSTGIQQLVHLDWRADGNRGEEDGTSYSGEIAIESLGSVQFTTESKFSSDNNPLYAKLVFSLKNGAIASLEFERAVKLLIDQNSDGEPDSGKYFISLDHFLDTDFTLTPLVQIAEMNQPPQVLKPYIAPDFAFEGDQLEIYGIRYNDPDTPENELTVSYQWTKGNEVIPDQNESILPAVFATAGDRIKAYIIVSDGEFTVSSQPAEIYINFN
ncbi:hypothetical protein QX776_15345 [Alteromonadaceae bacterium BrNp21-10]|nr:hypothetical protein [Alteromonadaceae bacterium BrNp21-10]